VEPVLSEILRSLCWLRMTQGARVRTTQTDGLAKGPPCVIARQFTDEAIPASAAALARHWFASLAMSVGVNYSHDWWWHPVVGVSLFDLQLPDYF